MSQIKLTQFVSGETSEAVVSRMMRARKIAETSTCKQKHGAVLMQGARVLAVGINAFRNDPANLGLDGETPNPRSLELLSMLKWLRLLLFLIEMFLILLFM